ncbi:hypothetical protein HYPSUDRAFT_32615 [Hypholoma sublateritium FD-334 SS-4]|uniref:Uncharacterized protein n=1 Tax=Hypholoma sublateritium (strain FD-334 SS-4) TaxID=945553 RepID=A0A0D2PLL4_HYPSF|nr:hypothetical protein HYPSUDRAFT_32615 [Hypholoma sublateritium FD-334 SS-4]
MSASQFASFTAYTAPPDEISTTITTSHTSNASHNAWFSHSHESSYQSGAVPTFSDPPRNKSTDLREEPPINQWETKSGYRVNLLAFSAYLFGPISALLLLIFETQNDYVRFHAYQSALLTTPLVFIRTLLSVTQCPSWIKTVSTLTIVVISLSASLIAYRDASQHDLVYFHVPLIGGIAETWLYQE